MPRSEFQPTHVLTLLLSAALVLSFGLNVLLLRAHVDIWPEEQTDELAATAAELHLAQRLLTQCQGQRQQQDSLLQARFFLPAPNTPQPASYSTK